MSLRVEVKKLSQDVSIEDGAAITQNYVLFELPNGGLVKAAIDDSAAEALLDALVKGADSDKILRQDNGYEPPPMRSRRRSAPPQEEEPDEGPSPGFTETELPDGSHAQVFGGDSPPSPPAPPAKPAGRVVAVGKDSWGYPIVRAQGNVADPGEVGVGTNGGDEDGVASV